MAKRKRLKKSVKVFFVIIVLIIIGIIFGIKKYKEYLYHKTNEYKLTETTRICLLWLCCSWSQ